MKLEINFESLGDLKKQLGTLLEDMEVSPTQTSFSAVEMLDGCSNSVVEPSVEVAIQSVAPVEKAKRKPKVKDVVPEVAPVVTPQIAPSHLSEPILPVLDNVNTPKNFHSESEFIANFAKIMQNLVVSQTIDQTYIQNKCVTYGVPFIYSIASDKNKLIQLYNEMVHEGHITRKGNY